MELSREAIKKIRDIYYKEFGEQNSELLTTTQIVIIKAERPARLLTQACSMS